MTTHDITIQQATKDYEAWLARQCAVVADDLREKHALMRRSAFRFMRATFYRWAGTIPRLLPALARLPAVLSVGDLHAENYGTWRDAEGRSVWGINDFDEATEIPWPFDLVRLAASIRLTRLEIGGRQLAGDLLEGYRAGLAAPRPTLLDEQALKLRRLVVCTDMQRAAFWKDMGKLPDAAPPEEAAAALRAALPAPELAGRFASRTAGGGSLGRPRYVLIADWAGGRVVREAKALVPSAWDWAQGRTGEHDALARLAGGPFRAPDPWFAIRGDWIIRRLAADSRKADLGAAGAGLRREVLPAMGRELGSLHAASPRAGAVADSLRELKRDWLRDASRTAAAAVRADHEAWTEA